MLTLTLNLSPKTEQQLEKELTFLEQTTKQPKEFHIMEALTRYIEDKEGIKETEKIIKAKKYPPNYHIVEALIRYIEDMEDIRELEKHLEQEKAGKVKYYTSAEATQKLKELRAKHV